MPLCRIYSLVFRISQGDWRLLPATTGTNLLFHAVSPGPFSRSLSTCCIVKRLSGMPGTIGQGRPSSYRSRPQRATGLQHVEYMNGPNNAYQTIGLEYVLVWYRVPKLLE